MATYNEQLKEFVRVLCTNNIKKDGSLLFPYLHRHNKNPLIPIEETETALDKFAEWVESEQKRLGIIFGWKDRALFPHIIKALLYDGKGFLVPYLECYVNQTPEHQHPNDFSKDALGRRVPFYNFDKDTAMLAFLEGLYSHIEKPEEWLIAKKKELGSRNTEWIEEQNEDGKGIDTLAEPYMKAIEERINQDEKNG